LESKKKTFNFATSFEKARYNLCGASPQNLKMCFEDDACLPNGLFGIKLIEF